MLPNSYHRKQQGLSDLIFGDSGAKQARHTQEQTQADNAKRLAVQEDAAASKERTQTEALNARRRTAFGRSGRSLLLQGSETGVGGGAAVKSDTLG